MSGVRSQPDATQCEGPSSDQVVAGFLAGPTTFKSLQYRVQADWYLSVSAAYGRDIISYRMNGTNPVALPPEISPQQAFSSLFGTFSPLCEGPTRLA